MVFRKQQVNEGPYIGQDGKRYDIQSCIRTESMEWYETGETDSEGNPVMAQRVVINKGWDEYDSIEAAAIAYGLTLLPEPIEEEAEVEQ